jgi:LysW-gamma-L-lysine carboxypeptidase
MLIQKMVEFYSPTGSEKQLIEFLIIWANSHMFHAYKDEVGNFIATKGKGREILLVGHVDTVPGVIPVKIEQNQLYGRGAVDAKGSLACFLETAALCQTGKITIVGAVDEEGFSKGAKHILRKYRPECIIIGEPSGWNGITLGYKGRFLLRYHGENTKEHSSTNTLNCYERANRFYSSIMRFCDDYNQGKRLFEQLNIKITLMQTSQDDFSENITMELSFRTPPGFNKKPLEQLIDENKKDADVSLSESDDAVKTDKKNFLVSAFIGGIRSVNGKPVFKYKTGTSDMNILQSYGVPIVAYGPGDSMLDHTPYEHLDLSEYQKAIAVLKNVLQRCTT